MESYIAGDENALQEAWDIYYSVCRLLDLLNLCRGADVQVFQRIYKDLRARGVVSSSISTTTSTN